MSNFIIYTLDNNCCVNIIIGNNIVILNQQNNAHVFDCLKFLFYFFINYFYLLVVLRYLKFL